MKQNVLDYDEETAERTISQKYRETANTIASEFSATEFQPHPFLTNRHIQTIGGVYLRNSNDFKYLSDGSFLGLIGTSARSLLSSLWPGEEKLGLTNPDREGFYEERQRFETPDGDFFDVDFKYQHSIDNSDGVTNRKLSSKGMIIILHGLQSNSQSSLSVDLATAYRNEGFDVACMNFRGCSGEQNRKIGGYHLGFTDDLKQFLGHLKTQHEKTKATNAVDTVPQPLFLSGFSLGSNVVLKALGELGTRAHAEFNVYGAATCGAPFDQERNVEFLQAPGFNQAIYMGFLLKSMKARSLEQLSLFEGSEEWEKIDCDQVMNAETIADIENAVLAPVYGYKDHIDYYRKNSCLQFLDRITVPTLIINAKDDPFFDPSVFPFEKSSEACQTSPIRMVRTDHGGHLGFMFHQEGDGEDDMTSSRRQERASWMPSELSRFLSCAYERRTKLDEIGMALSEANSVASLR